MIRVVPRTSSTVWDVASALPCTVIVVAAAAPTRCGVAPARVNTSGPHAGLTQVELKRNLPEYPPADTIAVWSPAAVKVQCGEDCQDRGLQTRSPFGAYTSTLWAGLPAIAGLTAEKFIWSPTASPNRKQASRSRSVTSPRCSAMPDATPSTR